MRLMYSITKLRFYNMSLRKDKRVDSGTITVVKSPEKSVSLWLRWPMCSQVKMLLHLAIVYTRVMETWLSLA